MSKALIIIDKDRINDEGRPITDEDYKNYDISKYRHAAVTTHRKKKGDKNE